MFVKNFIERPVLSIVISLLITLVGAIAIPGAPHRSCDRELSWSQCCYR